MIDVTYVEPDGSRHRRTLEEGVTVMEGAVKNGVPGIDGDCGGACACATCHVYVDPDWMDRVGGASADEQEMLECATEEVRPTSRLSCQIAARPDLDGLVVHLPASQ